MKTLQYQFFGSQNSQDIDVAFVLDVLPETTQERANLSKHYSQMLAEIHGFTRPVNGNLVVAEKGVLTDVFKGTKDELNNALYYTYSLHAQYSESVISKLVERDVDLKFIRASRSILSYFTRTSIRVAVKDALKGDIDLKYQTLKDMDFVGVLASEVNDLDSRKSIAFQLGQAIGLDDGVELYTKDSIKALYPVLKPYLDREKTVFLQGLQDMLDIFLWKLDIRRHSMPLKFEYK
ncbi:MAG: hypothetical protein MUC49_01310 [Raineya sp.]|jgi:hypothetical protein|nr:hypothetical protein [Raineya sp.]